MRRWSLLLRIFLSEYLHLKPNIPYKRDDLHELDSQPVGFFFSSTLNNLSFV